MALPIRLEQVAPKPTAVVRRRASQDALSRVVPQACGEVWAFHKSSPLPGAGRHVALYLDCEINLEVGVEVAHPFAGSDTVFCSCTPGGLVAVAEHWGPYNKLGEAHSALLEWCAAQGHSLAGPSWEVYGHPDQDPSRILSEVYYLLRSAS